MDRFALASRKATEDAVAVVTRDVAVGTAVEPVVFAMTEFATIVPYDVVIAVVPVPVTAPVNVMDWFAVRYVLESKDPSPLTKLDEVDAVDEITPDPLFFKTPAVVNNDTVKDGVVAVPVNVGDAIGA
jgi:hypothetical protein